MSATMRTGKSKKIRAFALLAFLTALIGSSGESQANQTMSSLDGKIVLLPLANYTGNPEASKLVIPAIERAFSERGIGLIGPSEIYPVLRKHRIRSIGMIGTSSAKAIAAEYDVEYLLIGSVDYYSGDDYPAIGISLRLFDIAIMRPVWAASSQLFAGKNTGFLGKDGVSSLDALVSKAADDVTADFYDHPELGTAAVDFEPQIYAIIPFDEQDPDQQAGQLISNSMLAHLIRQGLYVVEPGAIREILLRSGRSPRGEIEYKLIDLLHDSLMVDFIITGAVEKFEANEPGTTSTSAKISLTARIIDTATRKITSSTFVNGESISREGLLTRRSGIQQSLVISKAAKKAIDDLVFPDKQAIRE